MENLNLENLNIPIEVIGENLCDGFAKYILSWLQVHVEGQRSQHNFVRGHGKALDLNSPASFRMNFESQFICKFKELDWMNEEVVQGCKYFSDPNRFAT